MKDKEALIILNMISGIGPARVRDLLNFCGSHSKILELSLSELNSIPGIGKKIADELSNWKTNINLEKELQLIEKAGVQIISMLDPEYPLILKQIYDPPLCLYVRGTLSPVTDTNIAIIGSRRVSNYGRRIATHIAESATYAKWTIISGLAYGIDSIAQQATVNAGGKTIAVLGGGLARIHPQDHIPLAREIIEKGGAIISEFPMEFAPTKWTFPMRNRIISGLSQGIIIVEAGLRSGSLITAKCGLEQGKTIFAVPGEIDSPQSKGTNHLIKNGAKLTESFDDVLEEFSFFPGFSCAEKPQEYYNSEDLSDEEKAIVAALKPGKLTADSLCLKLEMSAGDMLSLLMQMEMKRLINQLPGKHFELKK